MPWCVAGRLAPVLSVVVFVVIGLGACGGSSGSASSQTSESTSAEQGKSGGPVGKEESQQGRGSGKQRETAEQEIGGFGAEAATGSRQAVLVAEHAYLTSVADRRFAAACAVLSKQAERSLGEIAETRLRAKGCVAILPMALAGSTGGAVQEQLEGDVTKVRIHGREALVLYRTPVGLFAFPMIREAGEWRAASLSGSIVAPSAQTLNK